MLSLKNKIMSPPETYIQYPGYQTPAEVYGGTWTAIFDTEGIFFRTPGGNATTFGAGIQEDEFKAHTHVVKFSNAGSGYNDSRYGGDANKALSKTSESTGGTETRPRNRTVRIWKRTSQ